MTKDMRTCVVMQPAYLPWAGYFNLIDQSDVFIFLDDAQYTKAYKDSRHNRNWILIQGVRSPLTVPAIREELGQAILEIEVDDTQNWRKKHLRTLQQAYARHEFKTEMLNLVEPILLGKHSRLADINIDLICAIADALEVETEFVRASALPVTGQRTERLIEFCRHFKCAEYLSSPGAREYLEADGNFPESEISLRFLEYTPAPYTQQKTDDFVSHLSIVDVLASMGLKGASGYVKAGETNLDFFK